MKRRKFIIGLGAIAAGSLFCGAVMPENRIKTLPVKTFTPARALVLYFSQTGHTAIYGELVSDTLAERGIIVKACDYRKADEIKPEEFDLLVVGTPVNYMEVPLVFDKWLARLPQMNGTPAAAFVSFGGKGSNVNNTLCMLLDRLAGKGCVPVAQAAFGNMSTYAPTWSLGNEERTLAYRHLPDEETFSSVRAFATAALENTRAGRRLSYKREFDISGLFKGGVSIWASKALTSGHHIDKSTCIECLQCVESCPTGAVNQKTGEVNGEKCVLCLGCVNNCPVGAMKMSYLNKNLIGFKRFCEAHNITIKRPDKT